MLICYTFEPEKEKHLDLSRKTCIVSVTELSNSETEELKVNTKLHHEICFLMSYFLLLGSSSHKNEISINTF